MRHWNRRILLATLLLPVLTHGCALRTARDPEALASADVRVIEPVAPGRPLLLLLTIHNTGRKELRFISTGQHFPNAREFSATLQGAGAGPEKLEISNGPAVGGGAAGIVRIAPGNALEMPLATRPLAPGSYRITIESERWTLTVPPVEVLVPDHPAAAEQYDQELITRIHAGWPIAAHVAETWPTPWVQAKLVADIESGDAEAATAALRVLQRRRPVFQEGGVSKVPLPPGTAQAVLGAVQQQTASQDIDERFAMVLSGFVESERIEEAAIALIGLAPRMNPGQSRSIAIRAIGVSHSPAATAALYGYLVDPDPWSRASAASVLAHRHDASAIPVLLALNTMRVGRIGDPLYELSFFPDSPEAVTAIKAAAGDPTLKADAHRALDHMKQIKDNN